MSFYSAHVILNALLLCQWFHLSNITIFFGVCSDFFYKRNVVFVIAV